MRFEGWSDDEILNFIAQKEKKQKEYYECAIICSKDIIEAYEHLAKKYYRGK